MEKKDRVNRLIKIIMYIIFTILLFISIFIYNNSKNITFEQLLYSLIYSKGTSITSIIPGIKFVTIWTLIVLIITYVIKVLLYKLKKFFPINIKIKKKVYKINIFSNIKLKINILLISYILSTIIISINCFKIDEYIKTQFYDSGLYEKYYVDGKKVSITFPEKKRNLIYIYVESLEMTNASIKNGGKMQDSYIPNLEKLALNNINFSNTNTLGGAKNIYGTGWTMAALISQTSGLPLRVSMDSYDYEQYTDSLPGAYTLGDILNKNGYNNYFLLGSDANFANRKEYFISHGNYKILDYEYAKKNGWIDEDYYEWWGYEDSKLYDFAKIKLEEISKLEEAFNFTILTADTHFPDGYLDNSCPEISDNAYINSLNCTDIMLNNFINWIKKQDFYENTTIIISGDHLSMQPIFYDKINDRTIYNVIINSAIETSNNKNREFTTFDLYPTTLASLGITIEGDRLGLGTNLFSNEKTLVEKLGYDYFEEELKKKSLYYKNIILKK